MMVLVFRLSIEKQSEGAAYSPQYGNFCCAVPLIVALIPLQMANRKILTTNDDHHNL